SQSTNQARRGTKCNVPGWAGGETGDFNGLTLSHSSPVIVGSRGFSLNRGRGGRRKGPGGPHGGPGARRRATQLRLRTHEEPRGHQGQRRPDNESPVPATERILTHWKLLPFFVRDYTPILELQAKLEAVWVR